MPGKNYDFLILGGGIAGSTAAETIRRKSPNASIAIATDESERLYSRVLLPHFLRQKITIDQVYLRTPQSYLDNKIELFISHKVVGVDTSKRTVQFESGEKVAYGKLLIATGGHVKKLGITGSNLQGIFYLRTIADVKAVAEQVSQVKSGVVIGGGFIALEFAHSFAVRGLKVTLLVREPYFWQKALDEQSGKLLEKLLKKAGVEVLNNEEVDHFEGEWNLGKVVTKSGRQIEAGIVGVGVGIESDLSFTDGTEIILDGSGIAVDERLQTNVTGVWAAGDIAFFKDIVLGKSHKLGNWTNAMLQGQVAGENMAGGNRILETVSAYSISLFDSSVTFLGDTTKDESTQVIPRGSISEDSLTQIFLRNGIVVGATLINRISDRSPLAALIKSKVKLNNTSILADIKFDLSTLIPSQ